MARRSLWRGAISFGLIYVPVELYSATREHGLKLHFLDSRDFAPVGYERVNKTTGKSVDWGHIVRGYEYEKGRYVALSDADLKQANVKASETIDIASFTDAEQISPIYCDTPYYLLPGKGADKVYGLLRAALAAAGKVAIASFVMRGRQHLCMVAPGEDVMTLVTLRFESEVLAPAKADAPKAVKITSAELAMAGKLLAEMTRPWNPAQFHDTYREDLMARIREKIRKNQIHALASEPVPKSKPKAEVIDLMEALRNSLKLQAKHGPRRAPAKRPRKRA